MYEKAIKNSQYWLILLAFLGVFVTLRLVFLDLDSPLPLIFQDFLTLSLSVIVEALPFVIMGILLSTLISVYMPQKIIRALVSQNKFWKHLLVTNLGFLLPVCECGNVPMSRSLIMNGLHPSKAIGFLLSAPIINPITIATTMAAFSNDKEILVFRVVGAIFVANLVTLVFSRYKSDDMLQKSFVEYCQAESHNHHKKSQIIKGKIQHETQALLPPLIVGSLVAGMTQTFIPRNWLITLGDNPVISILIMMFLAFIISICANVDAFFALSFANFFSAGSIVAFLILGPMVDIKILSMLKSTFLPNILLMMTILIALSSLTIGLVVNYAF